MSDDRGNVLSLRDYRLAQEKAAELRAALHASWGGGTSGGGMDERVTRLEEQMKHSVETLQRLDRGQDQLRTDVVGIREGLATLTERVAHLPTLPQLWTTAIAIVVALGAVIALAIRFVPHAG